MRVCLIGQQNVGKSSIYNRLIGFSRAIVTDIEGTTTEQVSHHITIEDTHVELIDTPGRDESVRDMKALLGLYSADVYLLICDQKRGISGWEQEVGSHLHNLGYSDRVIVIVNKCDTAQDDVHAQPFFSLGFLPVLAVSATNKRNIDKIRDIILVKSTLQVTNIDNAGMNHDQADFTSIIIGRPNVGKSTLANTMSGEHDSRVSDAPGTTRDYISHSFFYKNNTIKVIDTAGLRKKGLIHDIEKIARSKIRTLIGIVHPTVLFLIDCEEGLTHRDKSLLQQVSRLQSPIVIGLNKFDTVRESAATSITKRIHAFYPRIPIIPISAKSGQYVDRLLDTAVEITKNYHQTISTPSLNKLINEQWIARPPRFPKNKICKCYYATQKSTGPQHFILFINKKEYLTSAFRRWVEKTIRIGFSFSGIPLSFSFYERERGTKKVD